MIPIDRDWLAAHPLPPVATDTDKNARGRVLIAGGSSIVPGAIALTGEAALRAGAGKIQLATVAAATIALGVAMPEAAVFGLPANEEGELAEEAGDRLVPLIGRCDCIVLGPGMGRGSAAAAILGRLLASDEEIGAMVIDAAAIAGARDCAAALRRHPCQRVMTPHAGEMAGLMDRDEDEVKADPGGIVREAADRFGAVVILKQAQTWVCAPGAEPLRFPGGGPGLATAGSGDVLAGIVGGLLARGTAPEDAAAWAVWLHGEAGRRRGALSGEIGFLARELPAEVPALIEEARSAP